MTQEDKDMKTMTFKQVRNLFFEEFPQFRHERRRGKQQNEFSTDCRCYFVDFVDYLHRDGQLTDRQRENITLIG